MSDTEEVRMGSALCWVSVEGAEVEMDSRMLLQKG